MTNRIGGHGGGSGIGGDVRLQHPGGEPLGHRPAVGVGLSGHLHAFGSSRVSGGAQTRARTRTESDPCITHLEISGIAPSCGPSASSTATRASTCGPPTSWSTTPRAAPRIRNTFPSLCRRMARASSVNSDFKARNAFRFRSAAVGYVGRSVDRVNNDFIINRNRDDCLARLGHFNGSILPGRQDEKGD